MKIIALLFVMLPFWSIAQRSDPYKAIIQDLYPTEAVETFDLREREARPSNFSS